MAADAQGNDLVSVAIPRTGFAAWNPNASTVPTADQLSATSIPTGYSFLGLFTKDGGYDEDAELGESLEFFQEGYALRSGTDKLTAKLTMAEFNTVTRSILGYAGAVRKNVAHVGMVGLITCTTFENDMSLIRGGLATIESVDVSQESRGELTTFEVTFNWVRQPATGFYRYKWTK